jgi:hypothetical protein
MDFLRWLLQGVVELFTKTVSLLAPAIEGLFAGFGLPIEAEMAQFLAALVLLVCSAWFFRRVFWGKPKMFEPQKIVLKTERSPLGVVVSDIVRWVGWGIVIGLGLVAAVWSFSGPP